jgi:outer membrane protein assembly factor BamE (lipoprotein component of BamABCDE complex)
MLKTYRCPLLWFLAAGLVLMLVGTAYTQSVRSRSNPTTTVATNTNEPRYADYKGVKIGMTVDEVHKKLGNPSQKIDDQEFYILSDTETVQICFDTSWKVCTISIDYTGPTGAPDYRAVVGDTVETRPDGSVWQLVRYEKAGFWVSYFRSVGPVPTTTITIQKLKVS